MDKEPLMSLKKLEPRFRRLRISFHTWLDEMLEETTEKVGCQQVPESVAARAIGLRMVRWGGLVG